MKKIVNLLTLIITVSSVSQMSTSGADNSMLPKITDVEMKSLNEEATRQFARDYIAQINRKDWMDGIKKYLPPNHDAFLKEHTAFRTSFANYKATIKRIFVEGDEVMLWLNVTANYAVDYSYKNSGGEDKLLQDFKAENQSLDWDETWYFNVVDGRFGTKWDMLKDNYAVMRGLRKKN